MFSKINWDAIGITTSTACAIHCAVLPFLISSLPIFGVNIINNNAFEYFMIVSAFLIGSTALLHGYRKHHQNYKPVLLFAGGILLLIAKQIWHEYQFWFLPLAVSSIVLAHIFNFRLCRSYSRVTKKTRKQVL